jgi:quercetin dioxygenase-like cupin family protein
MQHERNVFMKTTRILAAAALIAGSGAALHMAWSQQQPAIARTDIVRHDLATSGDEVVQVRVDFAHGAAFPPHSHPGAEIAYVIEGLLEYRVEGKEPVTLEPGQALFIAAGTIHSARNVGGGNAAELATYIVEKGRPLVMLDKPEPGE